MILIGIAKTRILSFLFEPIAELIAKITLYVECGTLLFYSVLILFIFGLLTLLITQLSIDSEVVNAILDISASGIKISTISDDNINYELLKEKLNQQSLSKFQSKGIQDILNKKNLNKNKKNSEFHFKYSENDDKEEEVKKE